jgi:hypothetical protein
VRIILAIEMLIWMNYIESALIFIIGVIVLRYWAIRNDYEVGIIYPVIICGVWFGLNFLLSRIIPTEIQADPGEVSNLFTLNSIISILAVLAVGIILAIYLYRITPLEALVMVGLAIIARFLFSLIWGILIGFILF